MKLPSYLSLPYPDQAPLPSRFKFNDVRYSPEMVRFFVERLTQPGDLVFDPFTGFGTTLLVAKEMQRKIVGLELKEDRIDYLRDELELGSSVIHADIKRYNLKKLGAVDFIMTSPPFMGRKDKANALTGYMYAGSYEDYLDEMSTIFKRIGSILRSKGYMVVEISNLKQDGYITTLAWDVCSVLREYYDFRGEVIIAWEGKDKGDGIYGYGYDHSYCLVFQAS